jgi:hypothetical protein
MGQGQGMTMGMGSAPSMGSSTIDSFPDELDLTPSAKGPDGGPSQEEIEANQPFYKKYVRLPLV